MADTIDPEFRTARGTDSPHDSSDSIEKDRLRFLAISEHVEEIIELVAKSQPAPRRDRLREDIQLCIALDRGVLPLALIFAATASMDRQDAHAFLARLPGFLSEEIIEALDRVSETLLMITDKDLQASGTVAASVVVQRSLPGGLPAGERILSRLLELVELQYPERCARHGEVFAPLRHVERSPTIGELPRLLIEISDALEDIACDRDVFLDDPVDLVPTSTADVESTVDLLKRARLQSGADLPMLSDELAQIDALAELLGWSQDSVLSLVSKLYRHKVMDSRSKIGLSAGSICSLLSDLNESLDIRISDILIDEERKTPGSFTYDFDRNALILNVFHHGGLTGKTLRDDYDGVLAQLQQSKADREATAISRAIDRYHSVRESVPADSAPVEEEEVEIEALAGFLGLPLPEVYDMVSELYSAKRVVFSRSENEGISVKGLRELLESLVPPGSALVISAEAEAPSHIAFSIDLERKKMLLHTSFEKITAMTLGLFAQERSVEPLPLAEPDPGASAGYQDADEPGSVAYELNMQRLIDEFALAGDHARESYEVLLEGCPAFRDSISIQTLRVLLATINARLEAEPRVDVVTGWSREIPGTAATDPFSIAWLTRHTEPGLTLNMLTFNFSYGETSRQLPALSNELLLDWCRHYKPKYTASEGEGEE